MPDGIQRVFKTPIADAGSTVALEVLGTIRREGGKTYKYVKFSGTTAVAAGDVCCYVLTDTAYQTVDKANSAVGAGVAAAAHPISVAEFGWIQVRGGAVINGAVPAQGAAVTTTGAGAGLVVVVAAVGNFPAGRMLDATNKILDCNFPF